MKISNPFSIKRQNKTPVDILETRHQPVRSFFRSFSGFLCACIFGGLLIVGLIWLAYIQLGIDSVNPTSPGQGPQVTFWFTVWGVIATIGIVKLAGLRPGSRFLRAFRKTFLIIAPLILIGTTIATIAQYVGYAHSAQHAGDCNMPTTLQTAIGATYPITTGKEAGTAFAVDSNGTLLTAYHIIQGAGSVYMDLTSGRVNLTVLHTDPDHDLALLKDPQPTPTYLRLTSNYSVSDEVYAIGYPGNTFYSGAASVSRGIISRIIQPSDVTRNFSDAPADQGYVQTDAAINPGNSGGPLISKCGVAGVVDAVSDSADLHKYNLPVSEQNISYAITSQTAQKVFGLK